LNRRISESSDKDVILQEMTKTITDLEAKVQNEGSTTSRSADRAVVKSSSIKTTVLNVMVVILSIALAVLYLDQRDLLSLDAMCAPILPGSHLDSSGTFDAPWWAPEQQKAELFLKVCGSRPRTQISWKNSKLSITDISNHSGKPKLLWRGKAPMGSIIGSRSIDIVSKDSTTRVAAPWTA
jgi:hypothetical protein